MEDQTPPVWKSFLLDMGGAITLLPLFAIWCSHIAGKQIQDWDSAISDWCHRPEQRKAWILFSRLGDGWLYAAYFFWMRETGEPGANRLAAALLIAWGIGSALKIIVRRIRPQAIIPIGAPWATPTQWLWAWRYYKRAAVYRSFPSQHAAVSIAFAYALWPNPFACGLALAVCCSRVLVGAHYLGDVLAGVLVGIVAGRLA
jgi:membrane-associated phospholipid phosphatase